MKFEEALKYLNNGRRIYLLDAPELGLKIRKTEDGYEVEEKFCIDLYVICECFGREWEVGEKRIYE